MRRIFLVGLALAAVSVAACDPIEIETANQAEPAGVTADGGDPGEARAELDTLVVGEWASMAGYSRDRFNHWIGQGHSCDTRDLVLQRDGEGVTTGDGCAITGGSWFSVYDGETITDSSAVDIDHMVPLANAWRTGAKEWDDDKREAFANDLDRPQLFAVTASSNRSKGDQDPSEWRPERKEFWCAYATDWISVKAYWSLRVTAAEKGALTEMLETCL